MREISFHALCFTRALPQDLCPEADSGASQGHYLDYDDLGKIHFQVLSEGQNAPVAVCLLAVLKLPPGNIILLFLSVSRSYYCNYKGYHSIVFWVVVNASHPSPVSHSPRR